MKKIFFLAYIILSGALALHSKERMNLAVLDLTPYDVPVKVSNTVADIIRSEFVNIDNFNLVDRNQMKSILDEQALQMTGCTDSACAVEFGKLLSARRIITGEVRRFQGKIIISIQYINVETGVSLFSEREEAAGMDSLLDTAKTVSKKFAKRIVSGDREVIVPVTRTGYYARAFVPGWAQIYVDSNTKGIILSGTFVLGALLAGYSYYNYFSADSDYDSINAATSIKDIDEKRERLDRASLYVNISLGILGGIYLINWIDAIFFTSGSLEKQLVFNKQEYKSPVFVCFNSGITEKKSGGTRFELGVACRI